MATTSSATEQLEQHRAAVREAERRASEAEAERLRSRRRLDRAKAPLADYFEALGAGERSRTPTSNVSYVRASGRRRLA